MFCVRQRALRARQRALRTRQRALRARQRALRAIQRALRTRQHALRDSVLCVNYVPDSVLCVQTACLTCQTACSVSISCDASRMRRYVPSLTIKDAGWVKEYCHYHSVTLGHQHLCHASKLGWSIFWKSSEYILGNDNVKSKLHSRRNYERVKFGEHLLPYRSEFGEQY
jgi:hypothetical protein